jgi:hypothetical protein
VRPLDLPIVEPQGSDQEMIDGLLLETFDFFNRETNPENGLIADSSRIGSPSSIAVVGLGISAQVVAAERGIISRAMAIGRILKVLRFFQASEQGESEHATGYKGFYYHFLDRKTGRRTWDCELSTIDTALLIAGVLTAAAYFDRDGDLESEIREIANELYLRIDWQWALNGGTTLTHGWKPVSGFLPYRWNKGYSEAHLLYVLALGSPTSPIGEEGYREWISTFELRTVYDIEYIYAGPLFIHQMSQIWLDLRGLGDDLNRKIGFDYFENSRRATYAQRAYAIDNPLGFNHYSENCWGFTASEGPGWAQLEIDGRKRTFYGYIARGAPGDIDDGTISPWAVVSSLPFAPEITLATIRHAIEKLDLKSPERDPGFDASFNPTFPEKNKNMNGWVSPWRLGLNQGPIILMTENFETGLIWKLMSRCPYVVKGLERAGFRRL